MLNKKLHLIYRSVLSQTKEIGNELLLKEKSEKILFLLLFVFYLSYSLFYAFETSLVTHSSRTYDMYLSFDNVGTFLRGYPNLGRHPLLQIFSYPFTFVGGLLSKYLGMGYKVLFFISLCSFFVSMSAVYINRYLKTVLELKNMESLLITAFYSLFFTNIILAFTTETFTISLFLLSFCILYFSKRIKENRPVRLFSYMFMAVGLGGVTITNGVKAGISIFFLKGAISSKVKIIATTICVFLLLVVLTGYDFSYWFVQNQAFSSDISGYTYWDKLSFFFGMPILIGSMCVVDAPLVMPPLPMIFYEPYSHWWQWGLIVIILGLVVYSIIKNYKEKLIQYLVLLFMCDILVHIVFRYGFHEGLIYGGHWVYLIPLFIGWLLKTLEGKCRQGLMILIGCLIIVLAVNNFVQMLDFTSLALEYFPKSDSLL